MTQHTESTLYPQTYYQHMRVALWGSVRLIVYGLAGIIHAVFPEIKSMQFYTSTGIIKLYRELVQSGRHDGEIIRHGTRPEDWKRDLP